MNKITGMVIFIGLLSASCQQERYVQGKRIYETYCLNCHMADGKGMGVIYPDLNKSSYLTALADKSTNLPCLIHNGTQSSLLKTVAMPAHKQITPAGMTNLINYISSKWGDKSIVTLESVNTQLALCVKY